MNEETRPDAEAVAGRAAQVIADCARQAVAARGQFLLALSGGATPRRMMRALADERVPWPQVHLFQVDERVAPDGHPDRNLTHLDTSLLRHLETPPAAVHAMPVTARDLASAAARYAGTLRAVAGDPPVLDLVHLGLGEDGHTASLFPDDDSTERDDADIAVTAPYAGVRRMTMTGGVINRARALVWVVTGSAKGPALARLRAGDPRILAGRIQRHSALVITDEAADAAARATA
ncbi:MAG: 6-phosphogluconolactonase [Vicinamibacterales bacterium]